MYFHDFIIQELNTLLFKTELTQLFNTSINSRNIKNNTFTGN